MKKLIESAAFTNAEAVLSQISFRPKEWRACFKDKEMEKAH